MVEKIEVSRDEVLHYSWIDHTWVYVYYTKNSITRDPLFSQIIKILLGRGILETTGQKLESIIMEDGYVFIRYNTDEIIEILKNAALWFLTGNLYAKDPQSPIGKFFAENKSIFYEFFDETKDILERKAYKYYFQRVDGRN
jgi:hypothetical protein